MRTDFFIRAHQNWGNSDFYPRVSGDMTHQEVLEAFLGQFYATKDPARQIILSHDIENNHLMQNMLSEKLGRRVELIVPQKGEKRDLVIAAMRNAKESLARKMAESATQGKLLRGLQKLLTSPIHQSALRFMTIRIFKVSLPLAP